MKFDQHIDEICGYHLSQARLEAVTEYDFPTTRVGVVGFGAWGPRVAARFASLCDVRIAAVCNRGAAGRALARRLYPEAKIYQRHQDLVDAADVDAVVITTPPGSHHEVARAALEAGKPIFMEKPMTVDVEQAIELQALSAARRVKLMVNHSALFEEASQRIKECLGDQRYGRLESFQAVRWRPDAEQHRGAVQTLAIHDLALLDFLTGATPAAVSADCHSYRHGADASSSVRLFYDHGPTASLSVRLGEVSTRVRRVEVELAAASILWEEEAPRRLAIASQGRVYRPSLSRRNDALTEAAAAFLGAIHHDRPIASDAALGLRTVEVMAACERSMSSGRPCLVPARKRKDETIHG